MLILKLITLLILILICIEDLASNTVHWWLFPVLTCLLGLLHGLRAGFGDLWRSALVNNAFLLIQLVLVMVYFAIKTRKPQFTTEGLLGLGDILFLSAIAIYLSFGNYIIFYVVSLCLVLAGWTVYSIAGRKRFKEIPLAGLQALLFVFFLAFDWWVRPIDITADNWILNMMSR